MPGDPGCGCTRCQSGASRAEKEQHAQFKAFLQRLGERERRWAAALEAQRLGHGGTRLVSQISGLDEKTIRRGRRELAEGLDAFPTWRSRAKGGGRKPDEKKAPPSKRGSSN
jgi:hypothetical protein